MEFSELFESTYNQNLHHEPRKFVELFEHNRILIEGQNISSNTIKYDNVTRLTSDYANSLTHNESYTKALPVIGKAIQLFEEHPDYQNQILLENKYYETLIFDRVVANFYTKKYEEAIEDLITLTQKFPDNERYSNWLNSTKLYKLKKFEKMFYILMGVALVADIVFSDDNPLMGRIAIVFFAGGLLTMGIFELVKWNMKRKST